MSLKIVGLSEINGPLVALEGIHGVGFEEMVELELQDGTTRTGRIVQMEAPSSFSMSRSGRSMPSKMFERIPGPSVADSGAPVPAISSPTRRPVVVS